MDQILQKEGIHLSAPCAGRGCCKACKVQVWKGSLPPSEKDLKTFSDAQIRQGWRLACQAYPQENCTILIPEEYFLTLEGYALDEQVPISSGTTTVRKENVEGNTYGIAIDLGTTTIVYELSDIRTNEILKTVSAVNPQRIFGADVISRIDQSNNGRRDLLKIMLRQQMKKDIALLMEKRDPDRISGIALSANTAMIHLLMGYSCEGLGQYPFTPENLDRIETNAQEMNLMEKAVDVSITEGISSYVGGDILAGMASTRIMEEEKVRLFVDLGTNAEMALWNGRDKIYVTSAPAGPAFEAANISCGVGSIEGAVCGICIQNGEHELRVIGTHEPVGFCGSGILEAVYELKKNNLIDETGLLKDPFFETGYPVGDLRITQQDIRQIQLAKAAVYSAIAILLEKAQIKPEQVEQIYLAGGFGYYLNVKKAIGIGLFPGVFNGKIKAVGNTSLQGTKELLNGNVTKEKFDTIKNACEEIYLANEKDFQGIFLENMDFM